MKKEKLVLSLVTFLILSFGLTAHSQTTEIYGQFRPRYEYRHGFGSLMPDNETAAQFISQRTRIGFKHSDQKFRLGFTLQNVGVWGETGTMSQSDVNGTAIHEAWGELLFNSKISLKAGRQQIVYDDHRIFGSVDWAQQGRSHDAAILRFKRRPECKLDIGVAYNALKESNYKEFYSINNYKALQFAHFKRDFDPFGVSLLFLNNGMAYRDIVDTIIINNNEEKVAYSQTIGTRLTYKRNRIGVNGAFYFQTGKVPFDSDGDGTMDQTNNLDAYYMALDLYYRILNGLTMGAGFELLSGTDITGSAGTDNSFKPYYGTNHKFNGWMDYFYVGNHMNWVGLTDYYISIVYRWRELSFTFMPHLFMSQAPLYKLEDMGNLKEMDKTLGTEFDFMISFNLAKNVAITAGYSQMFATESMQVLKGGNKDNTNNWVWLMIDIRPSFFTTERN